MQVEIIQLLDFTAQTAHMLTNCSRADCHFYRGASSDAQDANWCHMGLRACRTYS